MRRFLEWLDLILNSPLSTLPRGDPNRRFVRELTERPVLDDPEFYQAYYQGSGIPPAIPSRVRAVYARELGPRWQAVRPEDRANDFLPDLDWADLVFAVGRKFGLAIPLDDMIAMDGTFDSLVRYVAARSHE
jgi:hypothetical protein